ncbi:MAG: hypothetical protein EP332_08910 [Bacteroidetes bacterium]|nr:MAG: hypothetical protein EP332_08910 [Bacteroidota bacterium]
MGIAALAYLSYEAGTWISEHLMSDIVPGIATALEQLGVDKNDILINPDYISTEYSAHGDKNINHNIHIVYSISGTNTSTGATEILKFGISDYTRYGETRPAKQVQVLALDYEGRLAGLSYEILCYTHGRVAALGMEKALVSRYNPISLHLPYALIEQDKPEPVELEP